jgi:hypothetical protein
MRAFKLALGPLAIPCIPPLGVIIPTPEEGEFYQTGGEIRIRV